MPVTLLNDLWPEVDKDVNGDFYDQENEETGVVYRIYNVVTEKSYIGKAFSYVKNGAQKLRKHGSKDRFYKHWMAANNNVISDCPIFYKALRSSDIIDWFVYTLKVCSKKHLKEWETKLIKRYNTSDPKIGYNYFVGDNKPNSKKHLIKYQSAKAESNANRAIDGQLRKKKHSKNLPPNINYRILKKKDGTICGEGYFVQIKINGKLYNKAFLSMAEPMESKLEKAKKQLELFKLQANKKNTSGSKTSKRKKERKK